MFDTMTLIIAGAIGILAAACLFFCCFRRYEAAVFLAALSPLFSAVFTYSWLEETSVPVTTPGSYLRVGILLVLGATGVVKYAMHRSPALGPTPLAFKLFAALCLLAVLSGLYSLNPFFTIVRAVSLAALLGFLLGLYVWLADEGGMGRMRRALFWCVTLVTLLNLASLPVLGELAWMQNGVSRFRGLWGHPNTMGAFAAGSYPVLFLEGMHARKPGKVFIFGLVGILGVLHILTGSRASLLAAVAGLFLFHFVLRRHMKAVIASVVLLSAVLLALPGDSFFKHFERDTETGGESMFTLTGRMATWGASAVLISERPLLGYGYGVGGEVFSDPRFQDPRFAQWTGSARISLHNGYLSTLVEVGFIGFIISVLIYALPVLRARRYPPGHAKAFSLSIVFMGLMMNLVESSLGSSTVLDLFFWIGWTSLQAAGQGTRIGTES